MNNEILEQKIMREIGNVKPVINIEHLDYDEQFKDQQKTVQPVYASQNRYKGRVGDYLA